MRNRLRISLVIPAYNEESYLEACLDSALAQAMPFYEIIVVDNNSTDETASIAQRYRGVRLLRESRQGVVHARNTGFDSAAGDIIARIDADTRLPVDWTQQLSRAFRQDIDAVSGSLSVYDMAFSRIVSSIDRNFRRQMVKKMSERPFLYGANMAIRNHAWKLVRENCCDKTLHEDVDLALHLAERGLKVGYNANLTAEVSARRSDTAFLSYCSYASALPRTYADHSVDGYWRLFPMAGVAIANYIPLRLLYCGYDEDIGSFRLAKLFEVPASTPRVNPATFGD